MAQWHVVLSLWFAVFFSSCVASSNVIDLCFNCTVVGGYIDV